MFSPESGVAIFSYFWICHIPKMLNHITSRFKNVNKAWCFFMKQEKAKNISKGKDDWLFFVRCIGCRTSLWSLWRRGPWSRGRGSTAAQSSGPWTGRDQRTSPWLSSCLVCTLYRSKWSKRLEADYIIQPLERRVYMGWRILALNRFHYSSDLTLFTTNNNKY